MKSAPLAPARGNNLLEHLREILADFNGKYFRESVPEYVRWTDRESRLGTKFMITETVSSGNQPSSPEAALLFCRLTRLRCTIRPWRERERERERAREGEKERGRERGRKRERDSKKEGGREGGREGESEREKERERGRPQEAKEEEGEYSLDVYHESREPLMRQLFTTRCFQVR